jgi:hypothetical protein
MKLKVDINSILKAEQRVIRILAYDYREIKEYCEEMQKLKEASLQELKDAISLKKMKIELFINKKQHK